jgi:hypothetical protein
MVISKKKHEKSSGNGWEWRPSNWWMWMNVDHLDHQWFGATDALR